jgi:hypothetical protein
LGLIIGTGAISLCSLPLSLGDVSSVSYHEIFLVVKRSVTLASGVGLVAFSTSHDIQLSLLRKFVLLRSVFSSLSAVLPGLEALPPAF